MSKTNLAVSIETTEDLIRRYNENVCSMLADSQVLSYILVNTMEEFSNWRIPDVINTISDIAIRNVYVDPGYSNIGKIVGEQTVDLIPGEGEIRYDIRFSVRYGEECIRILLNLEAQKTTDAKKTEISYRKPHPVLSCTDGICTEKYRIYKRQLR